MHLSPSAASIKREKMQQFLDYFETKCTRSKQLTDEAKTIIPGGVQHNRLSITLPDCHRKAQDAYMWDADGNRYIDFLQAGGRPSGQHYAPVGQGLRTTRECGPSRTFS
jgi:glutamate-1-semialdehyde 2,1-aminomutase